jgi:small subunit ribosomal protein S6e
MAVFKFVIGDHGRTWQIEKAQQDCPVLGKKIGDLISGDFLGLSGYELRITGGTDKDGFPMRSDVEGIGKRTLVLTKGVGFRGRIKGRRKKAIPKKGARKRKIVRGNTISTDIVQINCTVVKAGEKPIAELLKK